MQLKKRPKHSVGDVDLARLNCTLYPCSNTNTRAKLRSGQEGGLQFESGEMSFGIRKTRKSEERENVKSFLERTA